MSDPVPAITEADAGGEVAAIFADIRHVLGVGVVNLIWRHLATHPGALPWVWGTLRPLYVDGSIGAEAAALHGALAFPELLPLPAQVLAAAGLSDLDIEAIRNVLAAYDRTNAMALIALSAALSRLDGAADASAAQSREMVPARPPDVLPLPSLLNLADMSPATAELVLMLNRLGTRQRDPVLASMYRHLAHWPPYLALAWTIVAPLEADGRLGPAIDDAVAKARVGAGRIADLLPTLSDAPAAHVAIREALERFTGDVIAKMVVICGLLRRQIACFERSH